MAKSYATQPFALIETPLHRGGKDASLDEFDSLASTMAVVHNALLRSLNSIYLQAPSAKALSNRKPFLQYCQTWYQIVHAHHSHEEAKLFPQIERICGEEGIMTANIQQHQAFEAGIQIYAEYVEECIHDPASFQPAKLTSIIDGFGKELSIHLADEVENLRELRKFGEPKGLAIHKAINDGGGEQMRNAGIFGAVPFILGAHDLEFEGGIWAHFPPAPSALLWVVRNVIWNVHSDWWVFAPCDSSGKMKELDTV